MKENDAGLKAVDWIDSGVTDAEVEGLAEAMQGNTAVKTVGLIGNRGVTNASMAALKAGLKASGVVVVGLDYTGVSEGEQRAVVAVFAQNAARRMKANDAGLETVNWYRSGVTDAEVEGLAEAMQGNTFHTFYIVCDQNHNLFSFNLIKHNKCTRCTMCNRVTKG
eukprot:COSAG01_NODE_5479_length_4233_cov_30.503145_3_plen_165_part_00